MKHALSYTVFAIVCLIIFSSTLVHIVPTSQAKPEPPDDSKFLQNIWAKLLSFIWFNIGSGKAPKYYYADPDYMEIDYLGNTTVDLVWGVENRTGEDKRRPYHRFQENVYPEYTLVYDVKFPKGVAEDAFHAVFDPPAFDVSEYDEYWQKEVEEGRIKEEDVLQPSTKLTLFLDIPSDPSNPIQNFILKVNVSIYKKYGDLIAPIKSGGFGIGAFFGKFWRANFNASIGHKNFSL